MYTYSYSGQINYIYCTSFLKRLNSVFKLQCCTVHCTVYFTFCTKILYYQKSFFYNIILTKVLSWCNAHYYKKSMCAKITEWCLVKLVVLVRRGGRWVLSLVKHWRSLCSASIQGEGFSKHADTGGRSFSSDLWNYIRPATYIKLRYNMYT